MIYKQCTVPAIEVTHTYTYHYGCVPGGVLRDDDTVALLLPLWRLVLDIGDGDCQLHRRVSVPTISGNDFPCDVSPL